MTRALEKERGRPLASDTDAAFTASVVEEDHGSFRLTVATAAPGGGALPTRTLVAKDCSELVTALVQVVSLALGPPPEPEPPATRSETPPDAVLEAPKRPPPAAAPPRDVEQSEAATSIFAPPPHERLGLFALLAELDAASLGAASASGRFEAGLHLGDIAELRAGLGYTPRQSTWENGATPPVGAAFTLVAGAASGCAALLRQGVRLPACAGLEVGSLHAEGLGVTPAKSEALPWVAARLDLRAELPLSSTLRLALAAQLRIPLLHHHFYTGGTLVHEIPSVSPGVAAGVEWSP